MAEIWLKKNVKKSLGAISKSAESPIERIFFCSLIVFGLMESIAFLTVSSNKMDIENFQACNEVMRRQSKILKKAFSDSNPDIPEEDIEDKLFAFVMNSDDLDDEFKEYFEYYHLIYDTLDLNNAFHVTPQAYIPNLKIDGKRVRVDVMIWIPNKPEFKWVIECDGFKYHSDKKTFTKDRKRDRKLQNLGYKVLRFSGTEIYHHPIESSGELFKYMVDFRNENETLV